MIFEFNDSKEAVIDKISADIADSRKYIKNGYKLSGSIKNNKIVLYPEDEYGRHSGFMTQEFHGKFQETQQGCALIGRFRAKTYVLVLLAVLLTVAIESLVSALIMKEISSAVMPGVIILIEVLYVAGLGRLSAETNEIICGYLRNL